MKPSIAIEGLASLRTRHALHCAGRAFSLPQQDQSAPNFTFDWTVYRAHNNRAWCDNNRPRPQHNAGPYDATGRIFNVLAVHHGTGLFSACDYESSDQQR
jgi:hypothetical protein